MFNHRSPKSIHHEGRGTSKAVVLAMKAGRLARKEAALLLFYANCGEGFRPAGKLVALKTGMSESYVYCGRRRLQELGLLKIDGKQITICWGNINTLADVARTWLPERGSREFKKRLPTYTRGIDRLHQIQQVDPNFLHGNAEGVIRTLSTCTQQEFTTLRRCCKGFTED